MNILTVTEANKYIKQIFERDATLAAVYVRGEISNFKHHYSGHCYFTLKDSQATMKAVMFKSRAQYLKFIPRDGLKVIAGGHITVFERDGQYQLYIDHLVPEGLGELTLAFEQLKEKLSKEGVFNPERKKALPLLPHSVGIVTSPTGAAIRDIITVSKRRYPGISLILYPVQVQGTEAPAQIAQAIRILNQQGQVDVIIVGRGGGSLEELWAFNEEIVVRAIAASSIPVVAAVGHQTDFTLADFAADRRAATPSQAAELVAPDVKDLCRYLLSLQNRLETAMRIDLKSQRARVEHLLSSRVLRMPYAMLLDKQQMTDQQVQRLEHRFKQIYLNKQHAFQVLAEKLAMLNPLGVLSRGYGIIRTRAGKIVRNTRDVSLGEQVQIVLQQGALTAEIIDIQEEFSGEAKKRNRQ
ncbi:exonuclease vii large subunit [Lucifera butyrica]|uniref:Exodeoxyribonuclease 7 large subunit n=1 Tax=Lucifera butyrica TaxID=1351585 RepID=A0A498RA36_9FIRM|nr:exodeoxyribonuclease VII large subunit [Lucifera butyrica]VBB08009.1 exonuclease vii large subunit [Lucifera butyrica]